MTERWEFLFVRVRQEEIFKKSWAHCREMINDFDATGETNNSEGAAVASAEAASSRPGTEDHKRTSVKMRILDNACKSLSGRWRFW